jgi:hypothetical protein
MKTLAFESAQDWNRRWPPGTLVQVELRHGESFVAETATYAQQWGRLAILTLRDRPGLWTASVLRPLP